MSYFGAPSSLSVDTLITPVQLCLPCPLASVFLVSWPAPGTAPGTEYTVNKHLSNGSEILRLASLTWFWFLKNEVVDRWKVASDLLLTSYYYFLSIAFFTLISKLGLSGKEEMNQLPVSPKGVSLKLPFFFVLWCWPWEHANMSYKMVPFLLRRDTEGTNPSRQF